MQVTGILPAKKPYKVVDRAPVKDKADAIGKGDNNILDKRQDNRLVVHIDHQGDGNQKWSRIRHNLVSKD